MGKSRKVLTMKSFLDQLFLKNTLNYQKQNDLKKLSKLAAAAKWEAAGLFLTKSTYPLQIHFLVASKGWTHNAVRWNAQSPEHCFFTFNPDLPKDQIQNLANRLQLLMPLIIAFHRSRDFIAGTIFINLGDYAEADGIALCSSRMNQILIPDTDFLESNGYISTRNHFELNEVPWEHRRPIAFWRGNATGIRSGHSWRTIPRIQLCKICSNPEVSRLFDVGISGLAQISKGESKEIEDSGLMRSYVPILSNNQYKYQIDIDGNSNAWAGLFQKLLSKSAVLKVKSSYGFQQWYYDRLVPWEHFVPVESEMGDLVEKTRWLIANDKKAMKIGQRGAEFALSLSYDAVINEALQNIRNVFLEGSSS
jgi:hypothetical protein